MTGTRPAIPRPLPRPTPVTQPFWDAAKRHELLIQQCPACAAHVFYPRENCPRCGSLDLAWVRAKGTGTVYSFTVARRPTHPAFAAPYVIAIVELDEGPRLTANIVACDPDTVRIGMGVRATFEDVDADTTLVMFEPSR